MRRAAVAALGLGLAACTARLPVTGVEWSKPDAGLQQVTFDQTECARQAEDAGQTADLLVGGVVDAGRNAIREGGRSAAYEQCMRARGYTPAGLEGA